MTDFDLKEYKRLKSYGIRLSGAWFLVATVLFFLKKGISVQYVFFPLASIVLVQTLFFPFSLQYTEKFLKNVLEFILALITKIAVTILFVLVITPLSFILRILKQKTLDVSIDRQRKSYWHDVPEEKIDNRHKRQF